MIQDILTPIETKFKVLKAFHGDSIIIFTYDGNGTPYNLIIDGGTAKTFDTVLKNELKVLPKIDLLVLTHIDSDHIKGLIKFIKNENYNSNQVHKYWFNSKNVKFIPSGVNISYGQAKDFEQLLVSKKVELNRLHEGIINNKKIELATGIVAEILSPTQDILDKLYQNWEELKMHVEPTIKDVNISKVVQSQISRGELRDLALQRFKPEKSLMLDIFNSSSIAFILTTFDLKILLLGDARPEILVAELQRLQYSVSNKLKVDYVKVSHHGSINNTTIELLDLIDCDRFIISTNGGTGKHRFPDREVIARIIFHPERVNSLFVNRRYIYLNYPLDLIEKKSGQFVCDIDFATGNWDLIDNVNVFPI